MSDDSSSSSDSSPVRKKPCVSFSKNDSDEETLNHDESIPVHDANQEDVSEFLLNIDLLRGPPDGSENKMSNAALRKIVGNMITWWSALPKDGNFIRHSATRWGRCQDGKSVLEKMNSLTLTSVDLRYVYNKEMFKRVRLDAMLRQRGFLESANLEGVEDVVGNGYSQDLGKIQDSISRAYQLLLAELQFRKTLDTAVDQGCPALADPFGYVPYTEGKLNDYQSFLVFILRALHDNSYRRYNNCVYEQIYSPLISTSDGRATRYPTRAWRRVSEIKDFVVSRTSKEDCFTQWQTMTGSNSLERATNYLSVCSDPEFLPLIPNRLWHAFHNGLYFVETTEFYSYSDIRIPEDVVACKYHDQNFDESMLKLPWNEIEVPFLEKVISYQFPVEAHSGDSKCERNECSHLISDELEKAKIIGWIYAFIGRLLFEVGHKDKWQVMPFFVGRAGTGKSLLLRCISYFYNAEDVEVLANNSQRGFGLETLVDKFLWMCMEVKYDFTLDQAQLQSMISGENVSVMRKNKTALSILWKVPGILAGNEFASWVDNSGSMARRMIPIFFEQKVQAENVDPHLETKVRNNIGYLLHKSACAYKAAFDEFGDNDLWGFFQVKDENDRALFDSKNKPIKDTILPRYFHSGKNRNQVESNPIMAFLKSETAVTVSETFRGMSWERFRAAANNFFQKENYKNFTWKDSKYKTVFEDLRIKKIKINQQFIEAHGLNGVFTDKDGQVYGIGTDWVCGVQEIENKRNHFGAELE